MQRAAQNEKGSMWSKLCRTSAEKKHEEPRRRASELSGPARKRLRMLHVEGVQYLTRACRPVMFVARG